MELSVILSALILGLSAGLRSLTPVAVLSFAFYLKLVQPSGWVAGLGSWAAVFITSVLAAGELAGDKLPFVPNRTDALPFAGRIFLGAFCGYALANAVNTNSGIASAAGAIGAVAGTFGGFNLRRHLTTSVEMLNLPVALAEDAVAISLAVAAVYISA